MPWLQILLDKGNITCNNNYNKWKRFRLLNFLHATILDFMTSLHCLYCWKAEVLLFETIGQCSDVMKSKIAAHGKSKSRNLFRLLLLLNITFPLSSKICNYLEQLSVNSHQQPRFPLMNARQNYTISYFPCASVSKQVFVWNHSH